MHTKIFLAIAASSGFIAVVLGAFGAHGLRNKLDQSLMSAYETGIQYHFYHTFAILAVALLIREFGEKVLLLLSGYAFLIGILLFCGSLYGLALGGPRWLGPITPLGGLAFLTAWILMLVAVVRN
ncbi:DUF423 domain-containing protein [Aurantivibrio infirmus]